MKLSSNKKLTILAGLLFGMLLFQNCSQVNFLSHDVSSQTNDQNGAGYGGMQPADYYRLIPDFTCENHVAAVSDVNVQAKSVTLTENKRLQCGAVQESLNPKLIDWSVFQSDIIGYQDGIFEAESVSPNSVPANLVEVWCRDKSDQTGIETITHFNRVTNLAVNRTYFATENADGTFANQAIPDFNVSRVVANKTVTISDDNGFELIVHRDQPAPEVGLFKAELTSQINDNIVTRNTFCRLGGTLDAKLWPIKQIVDVDVLFLKESSDKSYLGYTSTTGAAQAGQAFLYASTTDGATQSLVSQSLSNVNGNFILSPDVTRLIYLNDLNATSSANLMGFNLDGSANTVISSLTSSTSDYLISGDGLFLFYNNLFAPWLESTSLTTGTTIGLNPTLSAQQQIPDSGAIGFSDRFDVSSLHNLTAFICCNSQQQLYVENADGTHLSNITPQIPAGYSLQTLKFASPFTDQIVALVAFQDVGSNGSSILYAVHRDGSKAIEIPQGWNWSFTSRSGAFASLINSDLTQNMLINLNDASTFSLPPLSSSAYGNIGISTSQINSDSFFSLDSTAFISAQTTSAGSQIVSASLADGHITQICPGVVSETVREISPDVFVIVANDSEKQILNIYISSSAQDCHLVNSVPVDSFVLRSMSMVVSPDKQKILVVRNTSLVAGGPQAASLYYVPLNGRPAYIVNTPVYSTATIGTFDFFNNSQSVFFTGDQIRPGDHGVFIWNTPSN